MSDVLLSSKGPGVIGFSIAAVVLVGFGGLWLLVFDDRFNGNAKAEVLEDIEQSDSKISKIQSAILSTENKITRINQNLKDLREAISAQDQLEQARSRALQMDTLISQEEIELESRKDDFANYKAAYRKETRANAIGKQLGTLTTQDGQTYENATIKKVDAFGMTIAYSGGRKRIASKYLSAADQDLYQFSEEEVESIKQAQEQTVPDRKNHKAANEEKTLTREERKVAKLISIRDKGQDELREMRERKNILNQRHKKLVAERKASQLDKEISKIEKNISIYQKELGKLNKQIFDLQSKISK